MVKVYDGIFPKENIPNYLKYFDLKEKEFFEIIDKWANKNILYKQDEEWKLKVDIT